MNDKLKIVLINHITIANDIEDFMDSFIDEVNYDCYQFGHKISDGDSCAIMDILVKSRRK